MMLDKYLYYQKDDIKLFNGSAEEVLKEMPNESINMVMTSPPYWNLRSYSTNSQIWDGDKNCEHEWTENTVYGAKYWGRSKL